MNAFLELLLIAIGKRKSLSHQLSEQEWVNVYREANRQSLLGVILSGVERVCGTSSVNRPTFLMKWITQVVVLEQRNKFLDDKAIELIKIFADDGYRSCILKGQGVAKLYPDPQRRQCGDIDIWLEGERDEVLAYLKSKYLIGSPVIHHVDVTIFDNVPIEVHFIPSFAYSPFRYRRLKNFFSKKSSEQFSNYSEEYGFVLPTIEFNAVYFLLHIFHHVLHEGIGLRQLLDYYYILQRLEKKQKIEVFTTLRWMGLAKFTAAVMFVEKAFFELEEEYFLCAPNVSLGKVLYKEILLSGNFGQHDERNQKVNRDSNYRAYLHNIKRNMLFLKFCPSEVLWAPIWKPCHFLWRKAKGYI